MADEPRSRRTSELLSSYPDAIQTLEQPCDRQARVYTDAPTDYKVEPDGRIFVSSPCNTIITQFHSSEIFLPENETPLSIRCAFNGQRVLEMESRRLAVDDASYAILNLGQSFSSYIQSETEVEAFSVSFEPGFAEEVLRSLVTPDDQLLDVPKDDLGQPVLFFEKTYLHDEILSPQIFKLRDSVGKDWATYDWLEEQNHLLLEQLLHVHRNVKREIENLPAARRSTRAEIYLRLHRAKDFMDASLNQPLTLTQIAEVAWFSPHHFLRLFKQVFRETPHQYLTRKRIERAKHLLSKTDLSITDVCSEVGFESLGSFSWLFRRRVGISPETFRMRQRDEAAKKAILKKMPLRGSG
jgi:AraC-like DNA-binding protein